jgi:hypothetical protein
MIEPNLMFDTLRDVVARLNDLGVDYMVTGSVAMSAYVPARATMAIDVILEIEPSRENEFKERFADDYYVSLESIREARQRQSMFNMLNNLTGIKVDCIFRKPTQFETAKFGRRRRSKVGDIEFWVISKEDLILSKLEWARDSHSERQFDDIRNLLESGADEEMVQNSIENQGLREVWEAFVEWKTRVEK